MICSSEFISFRCVTATKLENHGRALPNVGAGGRKHRHARRRCHVRAVWAARAAAPSVIGRASDALGASGEGAALARAVAGPWAGAGARWRNHTGVCVRALRRADTGCDGGRERRPPRTVGRAGAPPVRPAPPGHKKRAACAALGKSRMEYAPPQRRLLLPVFNQPFALGVRNHRDGR